MPGYFDRAKAMEFTKSFKEGSLHRDMGAILSADLPGSYNPGPGLMKLERPVLIIHSHQDPMGDKTPEDIHALISSSSIRYLNRCGHFPSIEQPKAYGQMVQQFLGIYTQ